MSTLYLLGPDKLILLIMSLILIIILQTICLVYGFFSFKYERRKIWLSLLDAAVLCQLFLLMVRSAEIFNSSYCNFMLLHSYCTARILLFLLLLFLSAIVCINEKKILYLGIPVIAGLTLPFTEEATGRSFPMILGIAICFWLLMVLNQLISYHGERQIHLSAFSVKEAVDSMGFGILFCRVGGSCDGQILLSNEKMQQLMLTGSLLYNGKDFFDRIFYGHVIPQCKKEKMDGPPVYTLPDHSVWRFDLHFLNIRTRKCAILVASDMTKQKEIRDRLLAQDEELEKQNEKLKTMLKNVESICQKSERLRAKSRVHDILGHRISLLLRSVREQKEPDRALLLSIAEGLPEELSDISPGYSLLSVTKSFENLGISVSVDGKLPPEPELQQTFFEIITESLTNAVHHGYATKIQIRIRLTDHVWTLDITDNGHSGDEPVKEGGGLSGIRQKTAALGGTFYYTLKPHFTISIQIPEGGAL